MKLYELLDANNLSPQESKFLDDFKKEFFPNIYPDDGYDTYVLSYDTYAYVMNTEPDDVGYDFLLWRESLECDKNSFFATNLVYLAAAEKEIKRLKQALAGKEQ